MSARRCKAQIAPVIATLMDVRAVVAWIAELRTTFGEAMVAPNAARREASFKRLWMYRREAQARLDAITAPGLRRRCADLQRQIDAVHYEAATFWASHAQVDDGPERGGVVVDLAQAMNRKLGLQGYYRIWWRRKGPAHLVPTSSATTDTLCGRDAVTSAWSDAPPARAICARCAAALPGCGQATASAQQELTAAP